MKKNRIVLHAGIFIVIAHTIILMTNAIEVRYEAMLFIAFHVALAFIIPRLALYFSE